MTASLALGGAAGCDSPRAPPLFSRPRGVPAHLRGQSIVFATTLDLNGFGRGVLVETRDGRPIKIEGNPLHPASLGATDVWAQAEVLSLYDPDRSLTVREFGAARPAEALIEPMRLERNALVMNAGHGLRILSPPVTSPTTRALMETLLATFPEARWHQYAPISDDNARAGAELAFGRPIDTVFDLTRADVLVCLGGDLFLEAPGHVRYAADWARGRGLGIDAGRPPRLYAVESRPSLTGAKADHRVALHPTQFEGFVRAIRGALRGTPAPKDGSVHPGAMAIAADLARAGPRGLVVAGREQPPRVHALVHAINGELGAPGTTLRYIEPVAAFPSGLVQSLAALAEAMGRGDVSHLVILGGNPAYDAPADLDFPRLLRRVPISVHLSGAFDETSALCRWHLPERHVLESWGDLRAFDGTAGLQQPATEPVGAGFSPDEAIALLIGQPMQGREVLRAYWQQQLDGLTDPGWLRVLETGVVPGTQFPPLSPELRSDWDRGPPAVHEPREGISVLFSPDSSAWDGSYVDNAWLQELPRPLTKIVWGNAALVSPATAMELAVENGEVVRIGIEGWSVEAPVWILPGHAPGTMTLPLGYGRPLAGRTGRGLGFDAYRIRLARHPWVLPGVEVAKTGQRRRIITTQDHHWLEGYGIIRTITPGDPAARQAEGPPASASLYPEYPYPGYAWGMAIDLEACIGCNACVIACQSENNIPVVGPEEVARGREMHWLRVDRYYSGDPADPETYFQPVPCMHCEKAPCEVVCPVNATVHSSEGLNDMVYNRCIGTRTCQNNCPYKVRRFNWFDYSRGEFNTIVASHETQVAIRERGVMEKCTYCVQRIRSEAIEARLEQRRIPDGAIQTACQQACPTRAIVFGDLSDPTTAVSRLRSSPRSYDLLGELNTQPRTFYLARVDNRTGPGDPAASPDG